MLNRRLLRIKVLQSLYAFFQSDSDDLGKAEQELFKSIELVYSLYIYLLLLCDEIINADRIDYEDASTKYFPTAEERNLDKRLFNSEFGKAIANNLRLKDTAKNRILTWQKDNELEECQNE
jgi:transcription antitermination protein NusB